MAAVIEPRVLKGFRDVLPVQESARLAILRRLQEVFRLHGFAPIDTPAIEYADVLLGKGGGETDKQVYRFTDHGGVVVRAEQTESDLVISVADTGNGIAPEHLPYVFEQFYQVSPSGQRRSGGLGLAVCK